MATCGTVTGYRAGCRCDDCRAANTAYGREYRDRNRDRINETGRLRRAKDPERIRAREKARRDRDPERIRAQQRASYRRNRAARTRYLRGKSARRAEVWTAAKSELIAHLGGACVDCGHADPRALTFDHVDPATKVDSVPTMVRNAGRITAAVWDEVAKCVLRCANCHMVKTFEEGDYHAGKARQRRELAA